MPDRLRWIPDSKDHWNVWLGATLVCDVTRANRFLLDSPGHDLVGAHSSMESAAAQIHAWVRWTDKVIAQEAPVIGGPRRASLQP